MTNEIRTFTPEQFEAFLARTDWAHTQEQDVTERLTREESYTDDNGDEATRDIPCAYGWAARTSTLEGVTITYTEGLNFDDHDRDSLTASTEGMEAPLTLEGARIVDEDGDERDIADFFEALRAGDFEDINYSFLDSEFDTTEDIDMTDDSNTIIVQRDNAPDLRLSGELIASASSSADNARSDYSGHTGRWTELALYKTTGGKFVCSQVGRTQWQGEHDRRSGTVCNDVTGVIQFFGHGWLAKDLYEEAGIHDVETVD